MLIDVVKHSNGTFSILFADSNTDNFQCLDDLAFSDLLPLIIHSLKPLENGLTTCPGCLAILAEQDRVINAALSRSDD